VQIREAVDFESFPSPSLLAERLDVSHRQPSDEGADDHRLQGLGAKQLRRVREERRDERLRGLAHLRDLDLELSLCGLHAAWAVAVLSPESKLRRPR
jgi:hypothetical protein